MEYRSARAREYLRLRCWRLWTVMAGCLLLSVLQGCLGVTQSSSDVANLNMTAHFTAKSTPESGVEVSAQLQRAGRAPPVYLRLAGGDKLIAANGLSVHDALSGRGGLFDTVAENSDFLVVMKERMRTLWDVGFLQIGTDPEYFAIFPHPRRAQSFYVSLERTTDQSIPDVEIALPPPFRILAPQSGSTISRSQAVQLQWSNYGTTYAMSLEIGAQCEGSSGYTQSVVSLSLVSEGDTGLKALSAARMFDHDPTDATCTVTLGLSRTRISTVPDAFGGGGTARGIERRVVSFISVP